MTRDSFPAASFLDFNVSTTFSRRAFLFTGGAFLALRTSKVRAASLPAPSAAPLAPLCLATSRTIYPPMLEQFIDKLDPANDDFVCEQYAVGMQKVLDSWAASLQSSGHSSDALHDHIAESIRFSAFTPSETVPLRKSGPLRSERRSFAGPEISGRKRLIAKWAAYIASFVSIETVELQIFGIRTAGESPLSVDTDIRFNLVGTAHGGSREQRVGVWHLNWEKTEPDQWTVQRWAAAPEIRSWLTGEGFTEVTGHCIAQESTGMAQLLPGIDHWRTALDGASGIDVYGNHGIAVGDIDGTGYDSFYVCQPSGLPNRLYRNRADGTFEDITDASGTGILDGTASALFADFQNRGVQDLLVVRSAGPLLFVNMGDGRFEPRPDAFHFARDPQGTFTSVAVADYNRDGILDVYFCVYSYYKGLNQYQFPAPYYDAQNGPPNFLFRNRGDGTFEDVTVPSGMDQNNNRFSFAVAWCDYDNDGWPDLYVANDFGRKNLYRNNGDGTFTDVAAKAGVEDYGPGMSTCWVDMDNDGLQDVYVANMWLPEGRRITADPHFLPGVDPAIRAIYQKHNAGNSFYRNTGNGAFEDRTAVAGTEKCGWSWSCASWDFDNDGWADIYVANGFVSGPNHSDLLSFSWRQVVARSLTPAGVSPDYELAWNAVNELLRADYSWSGYQRNVFFANNRDGSFSEVSGALGLDLIDDCRAYALSDFDHDGRLEFVLKNRTGPQLRILRNNLQGIGNSIAVRLTGHTSNRDAIGAVVTVESGAARQTKFVSAGSGFASQHTKELFFGLGESVQPVSISVRWPTGAVARYDGLPVNHRVQIDEGAEAFQSAPYPQAPSSARSSAPAVAPLSPPTVSTWLIAPLFGPDLSLPDLNGQVHQLSAMQGQPVLLTFVRPDCGDSRKQLELLQQSSGVLTAAGVSQFVVAVSLNRDQSSIKDLAQAAHATCPIHVADERAAGGWNLQYRYLFDRRRDMTLPMSFLLDASGAIIRIYQGVATPQAVADDWKSAPASADERFARALPFPNPYYGSGMVHDYLTFGIAFTQYGYTDEARAAFQRAIDANPRLQVAWFNLGTIYLNKKMYPEARKYLSEAVRLNPQDSDAWNNLGSISGMEQKYDEALDEFKHAALADPNHLNAVDNMMRIYRYLGRPADAQKALQELIAHAPGIADLHLALSMTLVAQDDLNGAREELETSVRLNPNSPDAINNLGAVLLRMGKSDQALEQFEACRRVAPNFDRAFINSALIYKRAGQTDKARQVLNEFLSRHPDNPDVRSALDKMGTQ
jgi:tetratricopeptide (TPR) repeat protein